jgi:YD repeat-containing protein
MASKTDMSNNQTTYGFDSQNELTGATPNGVNWTYLYDAEGRRVEKSSGTAAGQTVYYVYDGPNILATMDASNMRISVMTATRFGPWSATVSVVTPPVA